MLFQNPSNIDISGFLLIICSGAVGAIIGSVVTLFGTHLQNKAFAERQKESLKDQANQQSERLKHESEQRKLEREMIMRRDIYLSGIEAISQMQQFLLAFGNANQTTDSRENILTGTASALNKIGLIANFETVEALNKVSDCYNKNFPILIEKRLEWDNKLQDKIGIENYIQNLFQTNQQLVSRLYDQKEKSKAVQLELINAELFNNRNEIQKSQKSVDELNRTMLDQMGELLNLCFQVTTEFQKLGIDCILLIRRELEFPIDETKFRNLIVESAEKNSLHITSWYQAFIEKHRNEF